MLHPREPVSHLGLAYHRYGDRSFGIYQSDRLQHCHLIGQTGTGKSTLIANLVMQDAATSRGFCLIDPHGDLATLLAAQLGSRALVWNVADPHAPYGYNPLSPVPAALRPLVCSGFIDTLKQQWADSWGPRMEHLLRYAILALLDQPEADMRDIMRLYVDKPFRRQVLAGVRDRQVRAFWFDEFPKLNYLTAFDGVAPIANKLGAFLGHPVVRTALCEPKQPLRFRQIMDAGQGLIINLGKGQLGADNANLVGGLLVSAIGHAAFSRAGLTEANRRPFYLYIDEFHNFTTSAFAKLLAECRKYGLSVLLSQQNCAQTDRDTLAAVFGNVGTLLTLRVGANDAPLLAKQLGTIAPQHLLTLPNHHGYIRLLVEGQIRPAFSFRTRAFGTPKMAVGAD